MNSCLYKALVMHNRLEPKKNRFYYNVFMFYIDLDEIDTISKKITLVSRNRFNIFNFSDSDHLQLPREKPDRAKNNKEHITQFLKDNGVPGGYDRIMLLTNFRTWGYQFNPVSFYFVFNKQNEPVCAIAEVSNTFGEMKPYFLGIECFKNGKFHLNTKKYFYVSPFFDHDLNFNFVLPVPDEKLSIRVDNFKEDRRVFLSTLTGTRKELSNTNVVWYSIRFPFITLKVISLIHWQALKLWLKGVSYRKKGEHPELQKEVYKKQ